MGVSGQSRTICAQIRFTNKWLLGNSPQYERPVHNWSAFGLWKRANGKRNN